MACQAVQKWAKTNQITISFLNTLSGKGVIWVTERDWKLQSHFWGKFCDEMGIF